MSKNFKEDTTKTIDDFFIGEPVKEVKEVADIKPVQREHKSYYKGDNQLQISKTKTAIVSNTDPTKTIDKDGKTNKINNKTTTFKIDADITDFLNNVLYVKLINEGVKHYSQNIYINDLIRADMIKTLGLRANAKYEDIQQAWREYKEAHNL